MSNGEERDREIMTADNISNWLKVHWNIKRLLIMIILDWKLEKKNCIYAHITPNRKIIFLFIYSEQWWLFRRSYCLRQFSDNITIIILFNRLFILLSFTSLWHLSYSNRLFLACSRYDGICCNEIIDDNNDIRYSINHNQLIYSLVINMHLLMKSSLIICML